MDLGLKGKNAFVTGGSKGIGLETARLLASEGANVVIAARRPEALEEAQRDILATTGAKVAIHPLDVTRLDEIERLPDFVRKELGGRLDLLVNNAGTGIYKPFLEVTDEELLYGMSINFFAQFRICQRIVPLMKEQGGGSIVNVSGATGIRVTSPPMLSSCTGPAKSAEIRLSKVLASELAPFKIRVNCVVPGYVYTPERFGLWQETIVKRELNEADAEEERLKWTANQGMLDTRWGTPQELANVIVYALSERSSYVNGAVLVADNAMDKS
ncbi:3-oxoacyl-(acyl-carrier-protein) reductase [Delftia sp. Cs1-4]|uniref:SDR family NAD(P)-dependent oxidoreductase n=1 Tax=Delftia sp. (strain Cs1-4) TaxID=742013 RepID=UPI00020E7D24|nr:SDR family oxidoreductase [Delftia sp. Cs1-4]AEF88668.1 3-oxoacyl-(acyl-carrier-protein) reductase [Delftia sp. Cs1-4]